MRALVSKRPSKTYQAGHRSTWRKIPKGVDRKKKKKLDGREMKLQNGSKSTPKPKDDSLTASTEGVNFLGTDHHAKSQTVPPIKLQRMAPKSSNRELVAVALGQEGGGSRPEPGFKRKREGNNHKHEPLLYPYRSYWARTHTEPKKIAMLSGDGPLHRRRKRSAKKKRDG